MCTLTFIPIDKTSFVLTSNRDEAPDRATIEPAIYDIDGVKCVYPKDAVAGGTWLGVSDKKRLICLLNGGFTAHEREDSYRMSRGIVVKKLLIASDLITEVKAFHFEGIEPFTLIALEFLEALKLYELVWDGVKAHFKEKPILPTIWSSSLLYTPETKQKREKWFKTYLNAQNLSKESLLHFHKTAGDGNVENDLIMDRFFVKTKAITQIVLFKEEVKMRYEDLQTQKISETIL